MKLKKCFVCKKFKLLNQFYRHKQMKDGHLNKCKECTKKDVKNWYQKNKKQFQKYEKERNRNNFLRMFHHRYYGMKNRVEGRGTHNYSVTGKKRCSKEKFIEWCLLPSSYEQFFKIYNKWKSAGFPRKLSPSIDRIDNKKGYEISNLQWITQQQNSKKHAK